MGGYKLKLNFKNIFIVTVISVVAIIVVITIFDGVLNQRQEPRRSFVVENGKPMLGFCVDAMVIERWQKDINIVKTKAEELGFQVEVVNAYESGEKQIEQIRSLVKEGAVAIFVLPYDKDGLSEVIAEAKKEGVIIISYDRLIANADVDAYVSFDNVAVGEYMASALIEKAPTGNYVIINGSKLDHNAYMFNEGYYNVLQPYIDAEEITIISEVWADNWREEYAIDAVSKLLIEDVQIDAIIGANDRLAEGAISVLSEFGLVGAIPVVGHDADVSACQKIVEGKQLMTVYKPIKNLAEGAVELVYKMLQNQDVIVYETINDGKFDVPFYKFDVIPVDASNMRETVIKDLFHREEDVYRQD